MEYFISILLILLCCTGFFFIIAGLNFVKKLKGLYFLQVLGGILLFTTSAYALLNDTAKQADYLIKSCKHRIGNLIIKGNPDLVVFKNTGNEKIEIETMYATNFNINLVSLRPDDTLTLSIREHQGWPHSSIQFKYNNELIIVSF